MNRYIEYPKLQLRNHLNLTQIILLTIIVVEILILVFYYISIQGKEWKDTLGLILNMAVALGTILLFVVTYKYVLLTRSLVEETRKTREAQEKPSISFRIITDESDPNF